ncbi:hypothetical protein NDU88_010934 [Pleurodeles waltl]|uniref:Uncharacterized protein n=1 Tax=Pleurodeles waltl TaxID=8319 RepID=A0AAV7QYP4_PLEWA|nr:hypothetical protein NDU88_010934 [Pleurodeles waltl]
MKVVKVLNGAVQLEDGRVRNLRHRGRCVVRRSNVECGRHSIYDTRREVWEVAVGERSGPDIAPVMFPHEIEIKVIYSLLLVSVFTEGLKYQEE